MFDGMDITWDSFEEELEKLAEKHSPTEEEKKELLEKAKEAREDELKKKAAASFIQKMANVEKVNAFMNEGLSADAAVRKAYPDYSDEQVSAMVDQVEGKPEKTAAAGKSGYQKFFKGMLKGRGWTSPADIPAGKKKAFFNGVDKAWKSQAEKLAAPNIHPVIARGFRNELAKVAQGFLSMPSKAKMLRAVLAGLGLGGAGVAAAGVSTELADALGEGLQIPPPSGDTTRSLRGPVLHTDYNLKMRNPFYVDTTSSYR